MADIGTFDGQSLDSSGRLRQIIFKILRQIIFKMTPPTPSPCPPISRMITSFIIRMRCARGGEPISDQADDQLPATIQQAEITIDPRALNVVPALIADLGDEAAWRYVEFFTANIRNPHTRRAYARACSRFFAWCEERGLTLGRDPAASTSPPISRSCSKSISAPGVKQQLAAVRMLFDWLVTGQVVPTNPAAAVRGPKHVVKTGKTPVLEGAEWRKLLDIIPTETRARSARPRADRHPHLLASRASPRRLKMKVEDLRPRGAGWTVRLHEKGGKQHAMPCHHALAEALRAYIDAAGIAEDRKGWLFRTSARPQRQRAVRASR